MEVEINSTRKWNYILGQRMVISDFNRSCQLALQKRFPEHVNNYAYNFFLNGTILYKITYPLSHLILTRRILWALSLEQAPLGCEWSLWLSSQDFSRPRPPQKALPANPVPGRKNLPRPGGPSVLQPTASSPQQTQPLPAPALKVSLLNLLR